MRAIVALLKYFVGGAFLLCTIGLAFIVGGAALGFTFGTTASSFSALTILIAIGVFVLLVLYVGMVAMLISGHDRLCEMTALMAERNDILRVDPGQPN
ncbi:MAG: hypothetical protein V4513_02710 [Pseudomonadota bacterium]